MEEKTLTREQKRIQKRVLEEAQQTFSRLAKSFFDFFMDNDPEGEAIPAKEKEVIHKWRMYCKHRGLIEAAWDQMRLHCEQVRKDYVSAE